MKNIKKNLMKIFMSTNHKEIGTLYIIYGIIMGFVGALFSF
jgi:heme/copper-type cytochrome/quinol oxidase subunit 1